MRDKVLVTGASGLLGRQCVERMSSIGYAVVGLFHSRSPQQLYKETSSVQLFQCDVLDRAAVRDIFQENRFFSVIHCAAALPSREIGYRDTALSVNVFGTRNVVSEAFAAGCLNFVNCSSISVYSETPCSDSGWEESGDLTPPGDAYGFSKLLSERCVDYFNNRSNFHGVSLRLAGIHGPGRRDGVVYSFISAALKGEDIILHGDQSPFQLLFVDDFFKFVEFFFERGVKREKDVFNMSSFTFRSLKDLALLVRSVVGSSSNIVEIDVTTPNAPKFMNLSRYHKLVHGSRFSIDRFISNTVVWCRNQHGLT